MLNMRHNCSVPTSPSPTSTATASTPSMSAAASPNSKYSKSSSKHYSCTAKHCGGPTQSVLVQVAPVRRKKQTKHVYNPYSPFHPVTDEREGSSTANSSEEKLEPHVMSDAPVPGSEHLTKSDQPVSDKDGTSPFKAGPSKADSLEEESSVQPFSKKEL